MVVSVGESAPDFTLLDDQFKNVTLSELKGNYVVLCFFPNAYSGTVDGGCEFQLCQAGTTFKDSPNVKVLGISHDFPFQTAAWKKQIGLEFPLLSDPERAVIDTYIGTFDKGAFLVKVGAAQPGIPPMPAACRGCVVVDPEGKVKYVKVSVDADGMPHPGIIPPIAEIKSACGMST